MSKVANPLLACQREKTGPVTFDKFDYQYHWALFEMLQRYERDEVTIAFVELHEDVLLADSEDGERARFLYCQVKTTQPNWTSKKLLQRKAAAKKGEPKQNSVLAKMLLGVQPEKLCQSLSGLQLVVTSGFSLKLNDDSVEINPIPFDELHEDERKLLKASIETELGHSVHLRRVAFRKSDLVEKSYDDVIMGVIAKLVERKWPGSRTNVSGVYTALIDELRRKGKVTYDYEYWDDLVRYKGVPSARIGELLGKLSEMTDVEDLVELAQEQMKFWGNSPKRQRDLRNPLRAYALKSLTDRSLTHMQTRTGVLEHISQALGKLDELSQDEFEALVASCPTAVKEKALSADELFCTYLIEYLNFEKSTDGSALQETDSESTDQSA
ncbi:dsDNA nuclease domain-containing protein [Paraburkholderia strydomiana]|uniref:dsDNA nuclease domain-containing protein n=1 Tax=Paraburkholderia strydomiana TaxID=1245417 RepID=UPI0038BBBA97